MDVANECEKRIQSSFYVQFSTHSDRKCQQNISDSDDIYDHLKLVTANASLKDSSFGAECHSV